MNFFLRSFFIFLTVIQYIFFYLAALFILAVNACHFLLSLSHLVSLTLANNANLYIYLLLFFLLFLSGITCFSEEKMCVYTDIYILVGTF